MKQFQRKIENFICEHCGAEVSGNGYTNHCPHCLWSKHVDIHPGDRAAHCRGLMEPIGIEIKKGIYILHHRCRICGQEKHNKTAAGDNFEQILAIAAGRG